MTISKEGMDANATSVYLVSSEGVNLYVTIQGNGSVTITNLKVGKNYTVTEITAWSWEYDFQSVAVTGATTQVSIADAAITVTLGAGENGIHFTNRYNDPDWLSGEGRNENIFIDP